MHTQKILALLFLCSDALVRQREKNIIQDFTFGIISEAEAKKLLQRLKWFENELRILEEDFKKFNF